jgi:HTH-type transcriptional regulator / antitoxin HigA
MTNLAETFPPGEFLQEELEARGWSQTELAEIMGRPARLINEIIAGKRAITPETAVQLGDSLGTGAEVWLNLESLYQLSKVQVSDGKVARRARLHERFPVREVVKRGWVAANADVDTLERGLCVFYGLTSIDQHVRFCHAAKKTEPEHAPSMLQYAWLFRARQVATEMVTPVFSTTDLRKALPRLSALLTAPEESRHVAPLLAQCGVRFVIVEPIPGTKIDGACFWLDNQQPVVALSLRLDRIDNFWFVLRHEIEHVLREDGRDTGFVLDQDIEGTVSDDPAEVAANQAGAEFCVPQSDLSNFMARVGPFYSEERVVLFAQRLKIHPGLVVGQLQRRLGRFDLFRRYQVKIRSYLTASARTDGYGAIPNV